LFGLQKKGLFAQRWDKGSIQIDEIPELADQLSSEGARLFTQETADQMADLALQSLRMANPKGKAGESLYELTTGLIRRAA
jgi:geranylgeranyl pyrophosphate synthase